MNATVDNEGRMVYRHPITNAEMKKLDSLVRARNIERIDSYTWRERL